MNNIVKTIVIAAMALPAAVSLHSCSDSTSYADLLTSETHATNAYLADHRVVNSVPADSIFEEGEDAPFYRLDEDGMVYMQVINSGDRSDKAASDQLIYFRFTRYNLKTWAQTGELEGEGNADDFDYSSTSFRYGNYTLSSSYQYGSGIQLPLAYLGVECEVNLIIKSQYGFTSEIANVIPYLYHVRYFKSQV